MSEDDKGKQPAPTPVESTPAPASPPPTPPLDPTWIDLVKKGDDKSKREIKIPAPKKQEVKERRD